MSRAPRAVPVEKNLSCGEISMFYTWQMWRNLKFHHMWINFTWQMWRNLKFLHMWSNFKCLHMTDVEKNLKSPSLSAIFADSSRNRFVAIYALLCGENLSQKLCPWRKNDKYEVCLLIYTYINIVNNWNWIIVVCLMRRNPKLWVAIKQGLKCFLLSFADLIRI